MWPLAAQERKSQLIICMATRDVCLAVDFLSGGSEVTAVSDSHLSSEADKEHGVDTRFAM
ncbi:hypothetical protein J6590_036440 [Homalodisca vitripennis]|nr:hypothetical protein J6590_036440 [Homalodisca vitripennis]